MTTFVQTFRVRLRRASRIAAQLAELFDFLGFTFAAQLARGVLFAALLLMFLIEVFVRTTLRLAVFTFRFIGLRLLRLVRAFFGVGLAIMIACQPTVEINDWLSRSTALYHGK